MRSKTATIAVMALALFGSLVYAADENPLAGKWATDAVATAEVPQTQSAFAKLAAGAVNGGNSQGGISSNDSNQEKKGGGASVSVDDPAIILDLKIDAKGKLTGDINEITPRVIKKLKAEKGTVTGKKFEFETNEKSETISTMIRWAGELTDEKTITVMRLTKSGNPIDEKALLFRRAGK